MPRNGTLLGQRARTLVILLDQFYQFTLTTGKCVNVCFLAPLPTESYQTDIKLILYSKINSNHTG